MVKVKIDMTGWKMWEHGISDSRLMVIKQIEDYVTDTGKRIAMWLCECNCKEHSQVKARGSDIRNGNTKSCGCLQRERYTKV